MQEYSLTQSTKTQFINFNIQFNNVVSGYYRKYYKLQDFAAQVGGIFKALMTCGYVLVCVFYKNTYSEYLMNHFFVVQSGPTQKFFQQKVTCQKTMDTDNKKINTFFGSPMPPSKETEKVTDKPGNVQPIGKVKNKKIKIKGIRKFFPVELLIKCAKSTEKKTYISFNIAMNILFDYLNVISVLKTIHDSKQMKETMIRRNSSMQFRDPNLSMLRKKVVNNPTNNNTSNDINLNKSRAYIENDLDNSSKNNLSKDILSGSIAN